MLAIMETWISSEEGVIMTKLNRGKTVIDLVNRFKRGGSTASVFRKNIKVHLVWECDIFLFQFAQWEFIKNKNKFNIIVVYIHP